MKRKLVQMGKHCLMTAIPKKWLDKQKLGKGDHINFDEMEDYLLVSPKPLPKDKSISINLKDAQRYKIYRIMDILYDLGFKTVNIEYQSPEQLTWIMWAIKQLNDWRLETTGKNKCTIKTTNIEKEEFPILMRRLFLLVKEISSGMTEYMKGNRELIEEIRAKHLLALSTGGMIKRIISVNSLPSEYRYYYYVVLQLNEIVDHYEYLLRYLEKMTATPKNIVEMQKKDELIIEEAYNNFFKFKFDYFLDFHKNENIWKWFETEENPSLAYHLRAISERIRNIVVHTVGIRMR